MQKFEERPPYVRFELRAEEDRAASIAAGAYVARDVAYALITPMGSKDCIERRVDEWFEKLRQDVQEGRCPLEWLKAFQALYADWQQQRETPVDGTPIATWPPLSPSQVKTLQSLHVRTVEDLAAANEETIARIGMGGRALKQRATDWLASANNIGTVSEELSALRLANSALEASNNELREQLRLISLQLSNLQGPATSGSVGAPEAPLVAAPQAIELADILDASPAAAPSTSPAAAPKAKKL